MFRCAYPHDQRHEGRRRLRHFSVAQHPCRFKVHAVHATAEMDVPRKAKLRGDDGVEPARPTVCGKAAVTMWF
jgi:hypothetical protein